MDEPIEDPTIAENAFKGLMISEMIFYSATLLISSYMIVKYLILGKKYEITYLTAFYALTVLLVVSKLCNFITEYRMTGEIYQLYIWYISSSIGSQTKL